jgi:hypothetical protein
MSRVITAPGIGSSTETVSLESTGSASARAGRRASSRSAFAAEGRAQLGASDTLQVDALEPSDAYESKEYLNLINERLDELGLANLDWPVSRAGSAACVAEQADAARCGDAQ